MERDVMRRAALGYVERLGWSVFPLAGKVPAGGRGYLDATSDAATIGEMWNRHPAANVGVSCIASGFVAIDVDPRHGGDATLAEMEDGHGPLPHTVRQVTGGGGQHILFAGSNTWQVPPKGSLGSGIDVKWRGYIVVAPSVHPVTSRRYTWMPDHHPLTCAIAPLPEWMLPKLFPTAEPRPSVQMRPAIEEAAGWGPKPRYSRAALRRACEAIEQAPAGQQDPTLNAEAFSIGRLIGAGLMPRQLALDCLTYSGTMMANEPGRRPWGQREITEKVFRAVQEGERQPREVAA